MTRVSDRTTPLVVAGALALCLIAGSVPRIVGDGGEYLAQALNFSAFNPPSLGRQAIPAIQQRISDLEPTLSEWSIDQATVPGSDRRRDFLHFWFYALLATPFVWITDTLGASPLHAFTAINLILAGIALRLLLPHVGSPATVLLFASPCIWWIDKAHTEVFTVSLLTIAFVTMRDRPWWALVAAGAAATQNPPITVVVLLILATELARRRLTIFRDKRLLAGAVIALALVALQPGYTYMRHGTPSLLLNATMPGLPAPAEFSAAVLDPSMGLIGNHPVFLVATGAVTAWLAMRHARTLLTPDVFVALSALPVFLYAFGQTSNPHHGATPSLSRYALWLIPLTIPLWAAWRAQSTAHRGGLAWTVAVLSAVVSTFAFHPGVTQNSREPTWLATWLWTRHPSWNQPLPEVFSETLLHVEGTTVPVATEGCEKVLIGHRVDDAGVWPVPCLPAPVPDFCQQANALCYADRTGDSYAFRRAPGREVIALRRDDATWPREAEDHVRRVYADARWATLSDGSARIESLRAWNDLRLARFGTDAHFVLVARPTGADAALHLRPRHPLRGQMVDAATGEVATMLQFTGPAEALWEVPVPSGQRGLMILVLTRDEPTP